ncbi:MAG TPA: hypothetical protein VEI97_14350 [bacterium]|nr:hypothetical protein [bacterium]
MRLHCWAILLLLLAGCAGDEPVPAQGVGKGGAKGVPPIPQPHPGVAALPTREFNIEQFGVSGLYPEGWIVPQYTVATNTVLDLVQGADTYFNLGYIPQVRAKVAQAQPTATPEELEEAILSNTAESLATSDSYFRGTRKTLLNAGRLRFGPHQVATLTQLIERPVGLMESLPPEQRLDVFASQVHYLTLCPEGATRIARHFAWILGDDVWIAQVVASPQTFLQRAAEVEEVILPSLSWAPRTSTAPANP